MKEKKFKNFTSYNNFISLIFDVCFEKILHYIETDDDISGVNKIIYDSFFSNIFNNSDLNYKKFNIFFMNHFYFNPTSIVNCSYNIIKILKHYISIGLSFYIDSIETKEDLTPFLIKDEMYLYLSLFYSELVYLEKNYELLFTEKNYEIRLNTSRKANHFTPYLNKLISIIDMNEDNKYGENNNFQILLSDILYNEKEEYIFYEDICDIYTESSIRSLKQTYDLFYSGYIQQFISIFKNDKNFTSSRYFISTISKKRDIINNYCNRILSKEDMFKKTSILNYLQKNL